jgi:four helix bundle protein
MSIPTNIVEGHGQASRGDFGRFLGYAINSGAELEQHLITAESIGAIGEADSRSILASLIEVRKMVYGLRASLSRSRARATSATTATENTKSQADSD